MHSDLKSRLSDKCYISMPLLGQAEAKNILMSSVMQYNHSINSKIQDCVLKSVQECTVPLYSKVVTFAIVAFDILLHNVFRYWPGKHPGG